VVSPFEWAHIVSRMASTFMPGESEIASAGTIGVTSQPRLGKRVEGNNRTDEGKETAMIGVLIAVLFAALVWAICVALGLPSIVGIVAAILVLLAGIPSGGFGFGSRFDARYR
jgi:hypothetical protein